MIRDADDADVRAIADLAERQRTLYERAQPQFWRRAADAVDLHGPWLAAMVDDPAVLSLVAAEDDALVGYLFATVVPSPPVYSPGGPTGMVDDFAVTDPARWSDVGALLLSEARARLLTAGAVQFVVVCGHHDAPKRRALDAAGMSLASEWYVQPTTPG